MLKERKKSIVGPNQNAKYKKVVDRQAGYFVSWSESKSTYAVSKVVDDRE